VGSVGWAKCVRVESRIGGPRAGTAAPSPGTKLHQTQQGLQDWIPDSSLAKTAVTDWLNIKWEWQLVAGGLIEISM
jgi:hypothetical protein